MEPKTESKFQIFSSITENYPAASRVALHIFNKEMQSKAKLVGLRHLLQNGVAVRWEDGQSWIRITTQKYEEWDGISCSLKHLVDPEMCLSSLNAAIKRTETRRI